MSLEGKMYEPPNAEPSPPQIYEVYMGYETLRGIVYHAFHGLPFEVMGFLVGRALKWEGEEYTEIQDYVPVRSESKRAGVVPAEGGLASAVTKYLMKLKGKIFVGWYHSHPSFGCFLSSIDLDSHRRYFSESYHVALVVDPVRKEFDIFKLHEAGYRKSSFAILEGVPSDERRR